MFVSPLDIQYLSSSPGPEYCVALRHHLHLGLTLGLKINRRVWCAVKRNPGPVWYRRALRGLSARFCGAGCSAAGTVTHRRPRRFHGNGFMDERMTLCLRENVFTADMCAIWRCAAEWFHSARPQKSNLIWPTFRGARPLEEIFVVVVVYVL